MHPSTELHDLTIKIARAISDGDVAVLERHTSAIRERPSSARIPTSGGPTWLDCVTRSWTNTRPG